MEDAESTWVKVGGGALPGQVWSELGLSLCPSVCLPLLELAQGRNPSSVSQTSAHPGRAKPGPAGPQALIRSKCSPDEGNAHQFQE